MKYIKVEDVRARLGVDAELLDLLITEQVLVLKRTLEGELVMTAAEAERARVAVMLMREMDVNLAGVEVILHMRDELLTVRREFEEVLHELVYELRERVRDQAGDGRR
jgi:MerR family transcriptional regulator/heat shock protein HspR